MEAAQEELGVRCDEDVWGVRLLMGPSSKWPRTMYARILAHAGAASHALNDMYAQTPSKDGSKIYIDG